ncbi:MAG TPA: LptF/LptG family permease [Myxococcota bacterium]|jgi:LPS export ABC transporter permease LptG|nr:LptF/LptG family permease [Myxococcota bacterium]
MQILSRHLLARFLRSFVAILVVLLLAVLVGDLLLDLGDLLGDKANEGLAQALFAMVLDTPARYLPILLPMSSFAAAFVTLGSAARSFEITAMKAGGISPLRAILPVLAAAAALAGVALALDETVVLRAARAVESFDHGRGFALESGSFWHSSGDTIFNVRDSDPATRTLVGVTVLELTPTGRLRRSVQAPSARVERDGRWILQDALVRRFEGSALDPPATERAAMLEIAAPRKSDKVLLDEKASTLSIADLESAIRARTGSGGEVRRFEALLHERLSDPVAVLLFAWLAIPLALRVEETRSLAAPALQGVLVIVAFFFLRNLGSTLAAQGATPAAVTPWAILLLFATYGGVRLRQVPR